MNATQPPGVYPPIIGPGPPVAPAAPALPGAHDLPQNRPTAPMFPPPPPPGLAPGLGAPALNPVAGASVSFVFGENAGPFWTPSRVLLYGVPGIGKSTMAAFLPAPKFLDLDHGSEHLNVRRVTAADGSDINWSWELLRAALARDQLWEGVGSVVVDTGTEAQRLAREYVVRVKPHEKGFPVHNLEDYGYGKGYEFWADEFQALLVDLDRHVRAGRNVAIVCHACTDKAPNPEGDDYLRYEPDLYTSTSGKASIRNRVLRWATQALFMSYDVNVGKTGKAAGSGTRTLYGTQTATHVAKTRPALRSPIPLNRTEDIDTVWRTLSCVK